LEVADYFHLILPKENPTAAFLSTLATFAAGFVVYFVHLGIIFL
jgi:hypothetical protein